MFQFESGRYKDCLTATRKALNAFEKSSDNQNPLRIKVCFRQARALVQTGDLVGAGRLLEEITAEQPTLQPAKLLLEGVRNTLANPKADPRRTAERAAVLPRYCPAPWYMDDLCVC